MIPGKKKGRPGKTPPPLSGTESGPDGLPPSVIQPPGNLVLTGHTNASREGHPEWRRRKKVPRSHPWAAILPAVAARPERGCAGRKDFLPLGTLCPAEPEPLALGDRPGTAPSHHWDAGQLPQPVAHSLGLSGFHRPLVRTAAPYPHPLFLSSILCCVGAGLSSLPFGLPLRTLLGIVLYQLR